MSIIDDLKSGHIALADAIGKLEDARCMVRRFLKQADPQSDLAEAALSDAKIMAKEMDSLIDDATDISKDYLDILDTVDVAQVIRRNYAS